MHLSNTRLVDRALHRNRRETCGKHAGNARETRGKQRRQQNLVILYSRAPQRIGGLCLFLWLFCYEGFVLLYICISAFDVLLSMVIYCIWWFTAINVLLYVFLYCAYCITVPELSLRMMCYYSTCFISVDFSFLWRLYACEFLLCMLYYCDFLQLCMLYYLVNCV